MCVCEAHRRSQLVSLEVPFRLSTFTNADHRDAVANVQLSSKKWTYFGLVNQKGEPDGMGSGVGPRESYSGEFCSGLRHGWGLGLESAPSALGATVRYEGIWSNDLRHGYGYLRASRDVKYFGQIARNKRHGKALVLSANGKDQLWQTLWQENICISKCPLLAAAPSNEAATASSDSLSSSSSFSSSSSGGADPDLWSGETVAAALAAAGVATAVTQIFVDEQINGRVVAIMLSQNDVAQTLKRLGVENPYVRRFCHLLLCGLYSSFPKRRGAVPLKEPDPRSGAGSEADGQLSTSELKMGNLFLERRIGEGGFGRVYRGRYDFGGGSKLQVACKVFRPSELCRRNQQPAGAGAGSNVLLSFVLAPSMKKELLREFEAETRNHCRLHHPNIVKHYGVIRHPMYCVVSEYVPCGSLFDLLHRHKRKLSLKSWVKVAEQIAYAISYLHSRSLVHCDLKTSNILITESGDIKLCDFGLSRMTADVEDASIVGCIGTIQWMSPEALRGEALTTASDIYSLGVILWETLTGQIPYRTVPHEHVLVLVGYAGLSVMTINPFPQLDASLPPNIINVLKACLHPLPSARPSASKLTQFFQRGRQSKFLDLEQNLKTFFGL